MIVTPDIQLIERGWLSANNIVLRESPQPGAACAVVDSGYATHAAQTVALVQAALNGAPLRWLLNTHLHSDHCGGNAALQAQWPGVQTWVPPGLAEHVRNWNPVALSHAPTGQQCPPFRLDGVLRPGTDFVFGARRWQVHAAPGHDPHSVILFEPELRVLLSADALWENGFGIVFGELENPGDFERVASTLDHIESLSPAWVIPGHGRAFGDVAGALARARSRLEGFARDPARHARHAVKVLLKFKLLELRRAPRAQFIDWALGAEIFRLAQLCAQVSDADHARRAWLDEVLADLVRSGVAAFDGADVVDA